MSVVTLLMTAMGALVGGGILLLVVALRAQPPRPEKVSGTGAGLLARIGRQTLYGIGAGIGTLALTQWPVAGIGVGVLVSFWPALFGGAKGEREAIERLEGLAAWTESLRDTIAGAVGLEQAIPATVYAAAPSVRSELRLLVDRLRVRVPMPTALQRFADDLDDASADLIVAALILNSRLRGPGLRQVLTSLAESARAELDMRQRVYAGRRSTRRSVQIIVLITVAVVVGLSLLNRNYVEPYGTPVGQLVLVLIFGIFGGAFLWMRRLASVDTAERFLVQPKSAGQVPS